jgi:hypothetical protein
MTRWIMLAVLLWGLFLAMGAYLYGGRLAALRSAIIAGCVLAFLIFWWVALGQRQRRLNQESR